MSKNLNLLASVLGLLCLCGCSSMRPLDSTPPVAALKVSGQFTTHVGLRTAVFPAGEYRPLYEDKKGYFFQAPTKVVERGFLSNLLLDGGLFVKRGDALAKQWYVIDEFGVTTYGRLGTNILMEAPKP